MLSGAQVREKNVSKCRRRNGDGKGVCSCPEEHCRAGRASDGASGSKRANHSSRVPNVQRVKQQIGYAPRILYTDREEHAFFGVSVGFDM